MRIVLDSNVLISGLLSPFGAPARILDQLVLGSIQLAFDDRILDEYREVLNRPRFGFSAKDVEALLDHILLNGLQVAAGSVSFGEVPDPGDLPFAEVAVSAQIKYVVTGNQKHFVFLREFNITVLSPAEFIEILQK